MLEFARKVPYRKMTPKVTYSCENQNVFESTVAGQRKNVMGKAGDKVYKIR